MGCRHGMSVEDCRLLVVCLSLYQPFQTRCFQTWITAGGEGNGEIACMRDWLSRYLYNIALELSDRISVKCLLCHNNFTEYGVSKKLRLDFSSQVKEASFFIPFQRNVLAPHVNNNR